MSTIRVGDAILIQYNVRSGNEHLSFKMGSAFNSVSFNRLSIIHYRIESYAYVCMPMLYDHLIWFPTRLFFSEQRQTINNL